MTTNNKKMSAEEMARLIMAIAMDDKNNPFVVGFSTTPDVAPDPLVGNWNGGCTCDECRGEEAKYAKWMTEIEENDEKAYLQDLQDANKARMQAKQREYLDATSANAPRVTFNVQVFMARNPTREEVLEVCCTFANGNCLDINESYIWPMFEQLLGLRVEEFFNDKYALGYLSAEVFGQRNWKVVKGNEKFAILSRKFDEFVALAGDLSISARQLEQLLPAHK